MSELLEGIFNPKSIAVIGASTRQNSIGQQVMLGLVNEKYPGKIYPIHPTASEVLGLKAYKSVLDIPVDELDIAVYTVPEKLVLSCAKEAAKKKTKGHFVITSGFSEVGNTEQEKELVKIAHEGGGKVIGPNIVGLLLNSCSCNASFVPSLPYKGKTVLVSQSGALLIALFGVTLLKSFGCNAMISLGNMSDLDFADSINFFSNDPSTSCISLYVEGVKNGRALIEAGKRSKKPIVALKSGVSKHGAAAAASHTGSLAGAVKVYDAAFNQAHIIRAMDLDELLDMSQALALQPPMRGENVIVITNGGGIGVLSSDAAEFHGIPLKTAPADLQEQFAKCMPSFGSPKNPVDVTGGAGWKGYEDCLSIALKSEWVSAIAVLYCETGITLPMDIANAVLRPIAALGNIKPVVLCFVGGQKCTEASKFLIDRNLPVYDNPKKALCALSALHQYARFQSKTGEEFVPYEDAKSAKDKALDIIRSVRAQGRSALLEPESRMLFSAYGIPVTKFRFAKTEEEAVEAAKAVGFPVVMKIVSPEILHKSDAGGVKVNVKDEAGARAAWNAIMTSCKAKVPGANLHGILVAEMAPWGTEVIIGSVNDSSFGPTVMFGMGGIFVEVLKDVTFRIAPFSEGVAKEMIPEIKSYQILAGARGEKERDIGALAGVMSRISQLVWELRDELAETDANPVLVYENGSGLKVVDARIILTNPNAPKEAAPTHH